MNYDSDKKLLKLKKCEDLEIPFKPLDSQRASHEKFRTSTIHREFEYLEELIKNNTPLKNTKVEIMVGALHKSKHRKYNKSWGEAFYPVLMTITVNGQKRINEVEVLRIPYMDKSGCVYMDDTKKIIFGELTNEENISYEVKRAKDAVTHVLNVIGTSKSLSLRMDPTRMYRPPVFKMFKDEHRVFDSMEAFNYRDGFGEEIDLHDLFSNPYITYSFGRKGIVIPATKELLAKSFGLVGQLDPEVFTFGALRSVLNTRLSIDAALGYTLSRDVVLRNGDTINKGMLVTDKLLKILKMNLINVLHIRARPTALLGQELAEKVIVEKVPRGTALTPYAKSLLPDFEKYAYLPEDVVFEKPFVLLAGEKLFSNDIIDFLFDCGVEGVSIQLKDANVKGSDSSNSKYKSFFRFEQEIIGNGTLRKCDFLPGEKSEEYVYHKGVSDPFTASYFPECNYFTCWDLMGLVSMLGRTLTLPEIAETFDRDRDFLKTVNLTGEIFSRTLHETIRNHFTRYRLIISKYLAGDAAKESPFFGLNSAWKDAIRATNLVQQPRDVNPLSILDQASKVQVEHLTSTSNPAPSQRYLSLGQFGRLCPYNTPAGKRTGLVSALAIGSKVSDGRLTTVLNRIVKKGKNFRIDPTPVEMTAFEEMQFAIGDRCSLQLDSKGNIIPTKVLARVPAPWSPEEKVRIENTLSTELDFVTLNHCQQLSPAAMMIPFADANDPIRIQFGIHLISQCIYVRNSEVPLVMTSMYRDLYDYSDNFVYRAEDSGRVVSVRRNKVTVQYDSLGDKVIEFDETLQMYDMTISSNVQVGIGEAFEKGDVLIDTPISREGVFSPGVSPLTAYMCWDGSNYDDGITISELLSEKTTSVSTEVVERQESMMKGTPVPMVRNFFKFIKEGDLIGTIDRESTDTRRGSTSEPWRSTKSGVLYDIGRDVKMSKCTYKAYLLKFSKSQIGDKFAGRHSNKGTINLVEQNQNMPTLMNGEVTELILNLTGLPSRMNIGQIWDAQSGLVAKLLGIRVESDPFQGAGLDIIKRLIEFVWSLANVDSFEDVCKEFADIPKDLLKQAESRLPYIRQWRGVFNRNGCARVFNPKTGEFFPNPVLIGYPYFLKIHKEVDDAMHARAGGDIGVTYQRANGQPTGGAKKGGGQKYGEWEFVALIGHGMANYIRECANEKSDNVGARLNELLRSIGSARKAGLDLSSPKTVDNFVYYLECGGVKAEVDGYLGYDEEGIRGRVKYRGRQILESQRRRDEKDPDVDSAVSFYEELMKGVD